MRRSCDFHLQQVTVPYINIITDGRQPLFGSMLAHCVWSSPSTCISAAVQQLHIMSDEDGNHLGNWSTPSPDRSNYIYKYSHISVLYSILLQSKVSNWTATYCTQCIYPRLCYLHDSDQNWLADSMRSSKLGQLAATGHQVLIRIDQ